MKRLITAPCVGIVVGGLAEALVFVLLTIFDSSEANFALSDDQTVILAAVIGAIGGGFVGGIIGLVVAIRNAEGPAGLLLGSGIGLAAAIVVAIRVGLGDPLVDNWTIVALSMIPTGAAVGFVSAVSTTPSKETSSKEAPSKETPNREPQPPSPASRSYRIFE